MRWETQASEGLEVRPLPVPKQQLRTGTSTTSSQGSPSQYLLGSWGLSSLRALRSSKPLPPGSQGSRYPRAARDLMSVTSAL